jgi:hypothetical protein
LPDVLRNHRIGTDHRVVSHRHTTENDGTSPDYDAGTNDWILMICLGAIAVAFT